MVWESILIYLWESLQLWLSTIFVAPFKNLNMLWILVPVYLTWFFAEFFQEKHGTSMGNAITNAVVVFWGGFDWTRGTVTKLTEGVLYFGWNVVGRFLLALFLVIYGIIIMILGFKGNKLIKYIGRIREVTYVVVIFTPIFYEVASLTFQHIFAAVLFAPIFYFAIELLDKYMPNPKAVVEDLNDASGKGDQAGADFGSSSGNDFGSDFGGGSGGDSSSDFGDLGKGGDMGDLKL